jgi:predicted CXXCH cytochrome family protein
MLSMGSEPRAACRRGPTILFALAALPWIGAAPLDSIVQAQSVAERFAKARAEDYLGSEECGSCHASHYVSFARSGHSPFVSDPGLPLGRRGCEACHGPGAPHKSNLKDVISFKAMPEREVAAACLRCHGDLMKGAHWERNEHAQAGVSCVDCHTIHKKDRAAVFEPAAARAPKPLFGPGPPREGKLLDGGQAEVCGRCHRREVAEFRLPSHHPVPEGSMECSGCHAVHQGASARSKLNPLKRDCVLCHSQYAGPFVYEHDPATGGTGEGCLECHKAHGSAHPRLLRAFSRGLCGQCHTSRMATHFPGMSCWASNCHAAMHGSNTHPRLIRP